MALGNEIYNRFNKEKTFSLDTLKKNLQNHIMEYIITSDLPEGTVDLKLDIIGEETVSFSSDVTDHYVESNIAYQDQISLKPMTYSINGEVGELVWYQRDALSQTVGQVAQRLEGIISFLPTRSRAFTQMKKTVMKAAQWVDTASNIISRISNMAGDNPLNLTNQQQAFFVLTQIRENRYPVTVKTPWGILKNYVLMDCKMTQPKDTKDKSIVNIVFKELRTTTIGPLVPFDPEKYQGDAAFTNQPKVDNGQTDGTDASLPTTTQEVNGVEEEVCIVQVGDDVSNVSFSDEYGFSVQDPVTGEWYPESSTIYKNAVAKATKECENIIGALK